MRRLLINTASLVLALYGAAIGAQAKAPECPMGRVNSFWWKVAKDHDIGIELKHPAEYEEKRWESRSDTLGADFQLRWRIAKIVEFHQMRGSWIEQGPNMSVPPCAVQTRSGALVLFLERTSRRLSTGRDTVYFVGKGVFTPPGKPQTLVRIAAQDSVGFLEQIAMLSTLRFLDNPR